MADVEFDLRIGPIPFAFHYLVQCTEARPLEYLKSIDIIQTDLCNLLPVEMVSLEDILDQKNRLDNISLEHLEHTGSQLQDCSLAAEQLQKKPLFWHRNYMT